MNQPCSFVVAASLSKNDRLLLMQAINGGKPTWFGIEVPFDLNTLLAIVSIES